jgi:hypothetical protein
MSKINKNILPALRRNKYKLRIYFYKNTLFLQLKIKARKIKIVGEKHDLPKIVES